MTEKKKPIRHYTYSLFVCHWRDAWAYFIIHRQTGVEVDMTVVPTLARARREGQAAFAKASVLARDSDVRIDMRIRPPSRPVPRPKGRFPVASDLPMIEPVMVEVPKSTRAGKSRSLPPHHAARSGNGAQQGESEASGLYAHRSAKQAQIPEPTLDDLVAETRGNRTVLCEQDRHRRTPQHAVPVGLRPAREPRSSINTGYS
jgi:hypothetical protein